jgi:hypothetical protein
MAPADNPALRRGKLRTVVGRDLRSRFLAALGVVRSLRITEHIEKSPARVVSLGRGLLL